MTDKEAMAMALEALENSVDLVSHEAREAEKMYANVPTRLARVQGLVALEVAHEKAITALKEQLAQPEQEPVGFAGIEMWIGNTRIKKLMTQTELHFAIDPWAIVKFNSDSCIDALKEKNND
jgi:folylpolyglutamate synthase/dihydropteroate synthase